LVPKSLTLGDLERPIQGVTKVFAYPILSQERVNLWTSSCLAYIHSQGPCEQRPLKILAKESEGVSGADQTFYVPTVFSTSNFVRCFMRPIATKAH